MKELNFGVLGISPGNGHAYSWSAIFNGYNAEKMKLCPFPVIGEYLGKRKFPDDAIAGARVTHVWTQDFEKSKSIAEASNIEYVVKDREEMIGKIDAVLLARDDAENHFELILPFLKAGIPAYIDKPIAYSTKNAMKLFELEKFRGQVYTCSALRYAEELILTDGQKKHLGKINKVIGVIPKNWNQYAIHLIEPLLANFRGERIDTMTNFSRVVFNKSVSINFKWENDVEVSLETTGEDTGTITLHFFGENDNIVLTFKDTFTAFRNSLQVFTDSVRQKKEAISIEDTLRVIKLVEMGIE